MSQATLQPANGQDEHSAQKAATLLRMAGQIAEFFKSYPDEEAVPAIAEHINQFWSRRMREDFLASFDANSRELQPLVRRALPRIKAVRGG